MSASAATSFPQPMLKDYVFTERLGSGTYATVFKAYRKGGQREVVAVKCVNKASLNKVSTENLLTEIELLKTLKHDNIVELKDFQWDNQYIYLIMEYCSGGDLCGFIHATRTLSPYLAKRFLQQLALGLQCMREKNVSHMDLKPQNILLSSPRNPVIKIGDFGFAHYLIGETDAPYMRGSPLYMAPEIIVHKFYNAKADLWSVGVILYECLYGRAPFHSKSIEELQEKIIDPKPIELPYGVKISDDCRDLLLGLLKRDPEKRISFEDFFAHPFVDLEHRPTNHSLKKAIEVVTEAVKKDEEQDYKQAIDLYCRALQFFVSAIHYEKDSRKKEAIRLRVREYMQRGECLKQLLKPKVTQEAESNSSHHCDELVTLSEGNPELQAALKVIKSAQEKEKMEDYDGASQQYELALEAFMKILKCEPRGKRKDLLQKQMSVWMSQAEVVMNYLKVKDIKVHDNSIEEEEENSSLLAQTCVMQ